MIAYPVPAGILEVVAADRRETLSLPSWVGAVRANEMELEREAGWWRSWRGV